MLLKSLQDFNKQEGASSMLLKFAILTSKGHWLRIGQWLLELMVLRIQTKVQQIFDLKTAACKGEALDCFLCAAKLRILLAQPSGNHKHSFNKI